MERHDVRNYPPRQDSVPTARRHTAWLAVAWGRPELAETWGCTDRVVGKTVWAELAQSAPDSVQPPEQLRGRTHAVDRV